MIFVALVDGPSIIEGYFSNLVVETITFQPGAEAAPTPANHIPGS